MGESILVLNAGSSSIKFALFQYTDQINQHPAIAGQIDGIGVAGEMGGPGEQSARFKARNAAGQPLDDIALTLTGSPERQHCAALEFLVDWLHINATGWKVVGIGHRVVHGGEKFSRPVLLDAQSIEALHHFIPLAPLHQPHNLNGIATMRQHMPDVPQVACFDTAFHRSQPEIAQRFALPRSITAQGVRRYGFHGLSYEYIAKALPEYLDSDRADGRVVVAHLGNGASMCALHGGKSIATTMGFTAVDGLMMGTRCGSLDPGVLLYLMDYHGMDAGMLTRLLYRESGLLGVSGISSDMRLLLDSDQPAAKEAVDLFCYRIVRELGSLAAALGGLDALVFTAGIGERAATVRQAVCEKARWLGIDLDTTANSAHARKISTATSKVSVLVLATNEEWMIARHTAALIQ